MQKYKMLIRLRFVVFLIGMLLPISLFAQQIAVQGVVKDQTGETVIGASVMEKGTTNGTITDIDGRFSLKVSSKSVLTISYVGYKSKEIPVNVYITIEKYTIFQLKSIPVLIVCEDKKSYLNAG